METVTEYHERDGKRYVRLGNRGLYRLLRVLECDGCGAREEAVDQATIQSWAKVTTRWGDRDVTSCYFCPDCAVHRR